MQDIPPNVAEALKSLRTERGLSLSQTAELTGVSKAMLGQIELGKSSPTVATLWKIATGFNVAFSTFLEGGRAQTAPEIHHFRDLPVFEQGHSGMRVSPLIAFDEQLRMDVLKIELLPGASSESSPHEAGVIEHIIVFAGVLQLQLEGINHTVAAGESIRFHADIPHTYANTGEQSVIMHNIIHYPHPAP
ncbi:MULTISPECIES: helix-turn-helix domain-containing protein [Acinetobacter]|uniref:helix-turn-helix domain-containing protein n=1 Tax=Acinetobacter TaxID=469 RepID=UPI00029E1282|nr:MULTISPECIES: XRE family transcriptional regulator [Acinetobacter]EKU54961.1 DNA-binding helix-turn-helix protein [Acinetobacter sp. WC-323]MBJ8417402.1 helix-turn-helix transcriptional regulator [Acinetobacter courvalinii]